MQWVEILKDLGIAAALSTVIPFLVSRYYNKRDKREDDVSDLKEFKEEHESTSKKILEKLAKIENDFDIQKKSQQALLRDRILQGARFHRGLKGISVAERDSLELMYEQYHELGGNGTVTSAMEEIRKLPIIYDEDSDTQ